VYGFITSKKRNSLGGYIFIGNIITQALGLIRTVVKNHTDWPAFIDLGNFAATGNVFTILGLAMMDIRILSAFKPLTIKHVKFEIKTLRNIILVWFTITTFFTHLVSILNPFWPAIPKIFQTLKLYGIIIWAGTAIIYDNTQCLSLVILIFRHVGSLSNDPAADEKYRSIIRKYVLVTMIDWIGVLCFIISFLSKEYAYLFTNIALAVTGYHAFCIVYVYTEVVGVLSNRSTFANRTDGKTEVNASGPAGSNNNQLLKK